MDYSLGEAINVILSQWIRELGTQLILQTSNTGEIFMIYIADHVWAPPSRGISSEATT